MYEPLTLHAKFWKQQQQQQKQQQQQQKMKLLTVKLSLESSSYRFNRECSKKWPWSSKSHI